METHVPRTPDHPRSLGQTPAKSWSVPSPRSLVPTGASEANLAKACSCGHIFAEDALYCQRCGLKRPEVSFRILCNGQPLKGAWTGRQADLSGSGSTPPKASVTAPQGGADLVSAQEVVLLLRETLFALCEQLRIAQQTNELLEEQCARYYLDFSRLSGLAAASDVPASSAVEPVPGAAPSATEAVAVGEAPAPPQPVSVRAASARREAPASPQLADGRTPSAVQEAAQPARGRASAVAAAAARAAPQPAGGRTSGGPREVPASPQLAGARASLSAREAVPAGLRARASVDSTRSSGKEATQAAAKTSPKAVKVARFGGDSEVVKIHADCCSEASDDAVSKVSSELFEPNSPEEVRTMIQEFRKSRQCCYFDIAGEEECASLDSSERISVSRPDDGSKANAKLESRKTLKVDGGRSLPPRKFTDEDDAEAPDERVREEAKTMQLAETTWSSETPQAAPAADVRGRGKTITRRMPLGLVDGQAPRRLTLFRGARRASQATGAESSDEPAG